MPGWLIDTIGHLVFWIGIPTLFVFSAIAPFLFVKKVLKQRFTAVNILIAIICAVILLALDLYLLQQAIIWLAGEAFCGIYGC